MSAENELKLVRRQIETIESGEEAERLRGILASVGDYPYVDEAENESPR